VSIEIISEKKTQVGQVTVTFTVGRIVSQAKEPEANVGSAGTDPLTRPAMGSSRAVAGRSATATSERMDATAGETALNSPAVAETDANAKDDARLLSGVSTDPQNFPPESGER